MNKILGVRVDNLSKREILEKIESFLDEQSFHQIATINPEFILKAQEDRDFKNVLNMCDLNVADGVGIRFAFWRFGHKLKCRFTGVDLAHEILKLSEEKKLKVFLLINKNGLSKSEEIKKALLQIYPDLNINGVDVDLGKSILGLNLEPPDVLFCNFGAPDQEFFLNLTKNDRIRLAMGVGGTFDFVTGKIKRAPVWMRKIGLEWLYRLIQQPKRLKRIFNAVFVFPIRIIFTKNV